MIHSFKEIWYRLSIKNKIILFFVILMIIPNVMSMYSLLSAYEAMDDSKVKLNASFNLYKLKADIDENKNFLQQYIQQNDQHALKEVFSGHAELNQLLDEIREEVDDKEVYLLQKSVDFFYRSYIEESNKAITLRQNPNSVEDYYSSFFKVLLINGYLEGAIVDLIRVRLNEGNQHFMAVLEEVNVVKNVSIIGNIVIILLVLFFGYVFTNYLTRPIRQLAIASNLMAKGQFNIDVVTVESKDEVGILANRFNKMNANIKQLVTDLNEKAQVEKMLHEQELHNAEIQRLLHDAKYTSLQSQINPHYLFNTLNMIARTSMFEGAEKTTRFIQSLSKIFRYHLEDHSKAVSLRREVEIIEEYIFIQNERFSGRIKVDLIYDQSLNLETVFIPCFTIQPLVENGIIHGLESLVEGGRLRIKISSEEGRVHIRIVDNGIGIEQSRLAEILADSHREDTRGIGIFNVASRLRLFYHADCMVIRSKPGLGTLVLIDIPNIAITQEEDHIV